MGEIEGMKNRIFNGKDIGDSAVAFFDKLAYLESSDNYTKNGEKYIGRYQLGTDVLQDFGWIKKTGEKSVSWAGAKFKGEAVSKWKIRSKQDFLNNPAAQDEAVMKAMLERWKVVGKYREKICSKITVPSDARYLFFGNKYLKRKKKNGQYIYLPIEGEKGEFRKKLLSKKTQGYKSEDLRGKSFILTSSGIVAASHLCGQGAMSNALSRNFKGHYGIPVDGNAISSLFYHENLSGYDLSVIIGHKDSCEVGGKVVEKNDTQTDNKNINNQANIQGNRVNKEDENNNRNGVFIFNGQKFEEVWDTEEYKKDRYSNSKAPELVFVNPEEAVLKRLKVKFQDENMYNQDYIKYLETKTSKRVLEENREDINIILKIYDESTKDNDGIGNIIRQHGFDILRGREEVSEKLRIQDIVYYIWSYPVPNKSRIESLEHVLSQYSAKYVKYPDKKPLNNRGNVKSYIPRIQEISGSSKESGETGKIGKNALPEKYNKYMEGIKDIDEIIIRVPKKSSTEFSKMRCQNLIMELGEDTDENKKFYSLDENGISQHPLSKRLIDNIMIEFLSVQTGFKEENEERYFDNHKYKDSNIVRNYLLWYIEKQNGIDLPSKGDTGLYGRLENLGKEIRITTIIEDWISSKSAIKVRNIRKISSLIDESYNEYRDKSDYEKDKGILHKLFKESKELRDYAANLDAMDVYSFYKSFYNLQNIVKPKGELFVNNNCVLKCTFGEDISRIVINDATVTLRGGNQANINDKKIVPFKRCRAVGTCKPELIGLWEKNTDVKIRNYPALLNISTIKCKFGGIISVDDAGQREIETAVSNVKETKEILRDADCVYKLLVNVLGDINKNFMQTQLKKQAQKFSELRKYIKETENKLEPYITYNMKSALGFEKADEKNQKEYERLIKSNKSKMEAAKKGASSQREKELRGKIFTTFKETYKRVKQLSSPGFDTKGIIRKNGLSLCDYEKKSFYSAKMIPVIVYGYLMKAGNLEVNLTERQLLEAELNKDTSIKMNSQVESNLSGFNVLGKVQKIDESKIKKIKSSEIRMWLDMGVQLYVSLKKAPTEWDILKQIRKNGKRNALCPFNVMEWNENHRKNESLNIPASKTGEGVQTSDIKSPAKMQLQNNSISKSEENKKIENKKGCGDNCPHVGVKGYYSLNVKRIESVSRGTLSIFNITDPAGKEVEGFAGYVVEREGPDTIESGKKKRIIAGVHKLRWHMRPDKFKEGKIKRKGYMAIGVYNHTENSKGLYHDKFKRKVLIHEERWILIHPVGASYGLEGCLAPTKNYKRTGEYYTCSYQQSMEFLEKIRDFIIKIEGSKMKNWIEIKKFKLKIVNELKK